MQTPKYKVMLIHIALSTTLMLILISVMLLWWYPKGLFGIAGGWDGLKILLPIDMVLGPTLTFIFYKPGKKSAVFDLSAIACVQIAALSYGAFAVYLQHPQALVFAEGQLTTLTPNDYKAALKQLTENKQEAKKPSTLDSNLPPVVVAKPYPPEQFGEYLTSVLNSGLELAHRADRYQDLESSSTVLEKAKMSAESLEKKLGDNIDEQYDYYFLRTMYSNGVAAFSKESGRLVQVFPAQKAPATAALKDTASE